MNFKDITIKIEEEDPFINCKLGRKQYAEILENIVLLAPEGCVIALNGEWGIGKTTFIKMWKQYLTNKDFKTLYFNAWETDFVQDPLIGILGEFQNIEELLGNTADWEYLLKVAEEISIDTVFSFVRFSLSKIGLEGGFDKAKDEISKYIRPFREEIIRYKQESESLENFKCALSKCIGSLNDDKPLVFIIDELDRCNPHYAVKVLERVKHLFTVPRIVFVLAIDKEQLCNSIRGYFGSDRINAEEYLRRFIDFEYSLPEPNYERFYDFLYTQLGFEEIFNKFGRPSSVNDIPVILKRLFQSARLSLRQMTKNMTHIRVAFQTYNKNDYVFPYVFIVLIFLRQFKSDVYIKIKGHEYDIQQLTEIIEDVLRTSFSKPLRGEYKPDETMANLLAEFLVCYNKYEDRFYESNEGVSENIKLKICPNIVDVELLKKATEYYVAYPRLHGKMPEIISHVEILLNI